MGFSFTKVRGFKLPSHRQFDYQPVFYDERKDRLEDQIKNRKVLDDEEVVLETKAYSPNVKGRIKSHYNKSPRRKGIKASNIRLLIFIVILSGAAFYFLNDAFVAVLSF